MRRAARPLSPKWRRSAPFASVALRGDLGAAAVAGASSGVDRLGVSMSPGRMQLARMPYEAFCSASCSVKAIIAALVALQVTSG
jgi:hypothetical protein